jgi:hypothetical protein
MCACPGSVHERTVSSSCTVVFAIADGIMLAMPYMWAGYLRALAWLGIQVTHIVIAVAAVGLGYGAFKFRGRVFSGLRGRGAEDHEPG